MRDDPPVRRKGKRLLVASIGVATISYLGLQGGCTEDGEMVVTANLLIPPVESSHDPAMSVDAAAHDAGQDALISSGNLVPPPAPSGNLLPPPADAALEASGNLLPPPLDAAADAATDAAPPKDAAHPKDAKIDTGIPSSGNLLPVPPRETR